MFRHGDVLLLRSDGIPTEAICTARGNVVLAYGEATGHAHRVEESGAELWEHLGQRYLVLARPARLTHQEHGTIQLPAGSYKMAQQRVYTPREIRNVAD